MMKSTTKNCYYLTFKITKKVILVNNPLCFKILMRKGTMIILK